MAESQKSNKLLTAILIILIVILYTTYSAFIPLVLIGTLFIYTFVGPFFVKKRIKTDF